MVNVDKTSKPGMAYWNGSPAALQSSDTFFPAFHPMNDTMHASWVKPVILCSALPVVRQAQGVMNEPYVLQERGRKSVHNCPNKGRQMGRQLPASGSIAIGPNLANPCIFENAAVAV